MLEIPQPQCPIVVSQHLKSKVNANKTFALLYAATRLSGDCSKAKVLLA
jgi:hypothetical protein